VWEKKKKNSDRQKRLRERGRKRAYIDTVVKRWKIEGGQGGVPGVVEEHFLLDEGPVFPQGLLCITGRCSEGVKQLFVLLSCSTVPERHQTEKGSR